MQLQSRPDSCCSSRDCQAKAASDQSLAIWRVATSALLLGREGSNRAGRSWTQGGSTSTDSATYAATSNRLLSVARGGQSRSLGYDGSGNVPADTRFDGTAFGYGYDGDGRLATVTRNALPEASYGYDAFGRRVLKTAGGVTTHFMHDSDGHLLAEATGAGATTTEWLWLGDTPLAVVADVDTASPRLLWFHTDQLGTPQKLTDQAGNLAWDAVLEPFGELAGLTVNLVAQPLRLPGQYADPATGLHQNWWRDYDPSLGRYLQPDPLGIRAGSNLYLYANANPASSVDQDGQQAVSLGTYGGNAGAGIGLILGGPPGAIAGRVLGTGLGLGVGYCIANWDQVDRWLNQQMTPDQEALKELVDEVTNEGRRPLTPEEAETILDWADETKYPGRRASPGDVANPSNWKGHPERPPHVHLPGAGRGGHIPVQPGVRSRP